MKNSLVIALYSKGFTFVFLILIILNNDYSPDKIETMAY